MTIEEAQTAARNGVKITRDSWHGAFMIFRDGQYWLKNKDSLTQFNLVSPQYRDYEHATDYREWTEADRQ